MTTWQRWNLVFKCHLTEVVYQHDVQILGLNIIALIVYDKTMHGFLY
jgi:hypothetical protein